MFPEVTCLQTSYGRPDVSREAVECFVRQTYQPRRLIIINTHKDPVRFAPGYAEKHRIKVLNVKPFPYLSDVYRFALDQVTTPLFCFWDDDDLFLPWHIRDRVDAWYKVGVIRDEGRPKRIGNPQSIYAEGVHFRSLTQNMLVAQYLYEASDLRPPAGEPVWDMEWERLFVARGRTIQTLPGARPSYVYRWGTGEDHISSRPDKTGQHDNYLRNIEKKNHLDLSAPWRPGWNHDYPRKAQELFEKLGKFA